MKVIVLDIETTNSIDDPIAYDIGFAVIETETNNILEKHSYVVADVFLDEELMSSAFFADKIPQYWEDIKNGSRELRRFSTIFRIFREAVRKHNIKIVVAHNARFDYRGCNLTQRFLSSSKYRYFFPYGVEIWDSLKMAREVFNEDSEYCDFCVKNEYVTKNNKNRFTAEILYRFLTGNNDFVESHTGLEDVLIEKEIFIECLKRKNNINGALWG